MPRPPNNDGRLQTTARDRGDGLSRLFVRILLVLILLLTLQVVSRLFAAPKHPPATKSGAANCNGCMFQT